MDQYMNQVLDSIRAGSLAKVKTLVTSTKDANRADSNGKTISHYAVYYGMVDILNYLIEMKADIDNKCNYNNTPLFEAVEQGKQEVVKILLSHGADKNTVNNNGYTLLHVACSEGHLELVKLFIANGADVNALTTHGQTPLLSSVIQGHQHVAEYLIKCGADVNTVDDDGDAPLDVALNNQENLNSDKYVKLSRAYNYEQASSNAAKLTECQKLIEALIANGARCSLNRL